MRHKCFSSIVGVLATIVAGPASAINVGQVIGVDFAIGPNTPGAGSEPNFVVFDNNAPPGPVLGAAATDVTGASTAGVTVDLLSFDGASSEGVMGESVLGFGGAGVGDYSGTPFSDLTYLDGYFFRTDAPLTVQFNNLDDSLIYDLLLLPNGPTSQDNEVGIDINGVNVGSATYNEIRAGDVLSPFVVLGASTQGDGTLTASFTTTGVAGAAGLALVATQVFAPGDVDGDGDVDEIDYGFIRDNFRLTGATRAQGDLNRDFTVDFLDFIEWQENFPTPAPGGGAAATPEPAALSLALLLCLGRGNRVRSARN